MRRLWILAVAVLLLTSGESVVLAASAFASPGFQTQWNAGEALAPNFWGPLATARDGQQEPYKEASGGSRLVQYFDKGRMELTNGTVTNGLLASELLKGQIQAGDATFQAKPAPAISMAGDPNSGAPTYLDIATTGNGATAPKPDRFGEDLRGGLVNGVYNEVAAKQGSGNTAMAFFDPETKHNVMRAFLDYRNQVGLTTIGLAITEPLVSTFRVAGVSHVGAVQVFERRVLTYTPDNPDPFKVEMGNIGAHYYQWRYGSAPVAAPPSSPVATSPPPAAAPSPVPPPSAGVRLTGTGQTASKAVTLPPGTNVLTFTHNGKSNFIVTVYDSQGESTLLVNEIGVFSGKKWLAGGASYTFDIDADGAWSITSSLIGAQGASSFAGKGFDVSGTFAPPSGPTAFMFTHTGKSNFIVELSCDKSSYPDLIQNEIGPVSGSRVVKFPSGSTACFWAVEADGSWTIKPQA